MLHDIARFIDGTRDACMLFTVTGRLESNFKLTPEASIDFVKDMWKKGLITWMNMPDSGEPDWEDDSALIQLTQEGYKLI